MEDEITIDLAVLFRQMLQKIWIIIIATVIGAGGMFVYSSFFKTPLYQSDIKFYVNNTTYSSESSSYSVTTGELSAAQSLVDTYIVILNTRSVIEEIIDEGNFDYTYDEMASMINAYNVDGTEVFCVEITSESAQDSKKIANTIGEVLPEVVSETVQGSDMRIVDYAIEAQNQSYPITSRDVIIGALLGFILSAGIIVLQSLFDNTIRSQDYITQTYDYPILASIPEGEVKNKYYGSKSISKLSKIKRGL